MIIYFALLLFISLSYAKVLTKTQLKLITNILNNPTTPFEIKQKTNVLYIIMINGYINKSTILLRKIGFLLNLKKNYTNRPKSDYSNH